MDFYWYDMCHMTKRVIVNTSIFTSYTTMQKQGFRMYSLGRVPFSQDKMASQCGCKAKTMQCFQMHLDWCERSLSPWGSEYRRGVS